MNGNAKIGQLRQRLESQPMLEAVRDVFGIESTHEDLLHELFTAGTENWRMLAADHVRGDCLDVYAGYGKRSFLLGELAERVYAVESDREKLRFLAKRDDYESRSTVVPVHANISSLPFPDRSFDTIVATEEIFARGSTQGAISDVVSDLQRYLANDGSLLLLVAGWPQLSGLTNLLGIQSGYSDQVSPSVQGLRRVLESNPWRYRSILDAIGFESVTAYALWPGRRLPESAFAIESPHAADWLFRSSWQNESTAERIGQPLVNVFDRLGLLKHSFPSYLFVCSNGYSCDSNEVTDPIPNDETDQILLRGRSRSVVLDHADGEIVSVKKIPNRKRHAPFVYQETDTLQALNSTDAPIAETLPSGTVVQSRFGPVYCEQPAAGVPLTERMEQSVDSFRVALKLGLRWLKTFQQTYRGEQVTVSPAEIREDLSFERLGLSPPPISEPITMYETPCHGDFLPRNIYVENGEVTEVIDWEYSAVSEYAITDLAYYAIRVAATALGGLKQGIEAAFLQDTQYASILRNVIHDYCDDVGLPVRSFLLYLGYPWIRRAKMNYNRRAAISYTSLPGFVVPYIQSLWDQMDTLEQRFL